MAQRPFSVSTTSDIFSLVLWGIVNQLPAPDATTVWRVQYALTAATFSEWARFTKKHSQDIFHSASQSSQKAGARNAQFAVVSQSRPVRSQVTAHRDSVRGFRRTGVSTEG